ncbi:MAG: alanine--tRNA ligase, partial [Candidatus Omnitrophica bacterium]|nr:alanine--tRNA ligase [Candidatus Omnitrophota bacterium]
NFWPSNAKENGPNGPCGPCSEIFYDYEPEKGTVPKDPDDEPGRFSEVWNLVFTQFNRQDGGVLEPLPGKNIDTGMGLERLAAVLQGKKCNFDIDLFEPILAAVNKEVPGLATKQQRIITDHMRAVVFGITDGVVPSNEGRGYVMKKLIIDITDIVLRAGNAKPVIYKLVPSVVKSMGDAYPDIVKKADNISDIILSVEKAYIRVRQERMPQLKKEIQELLEKKTVQTPDDLGTLLFTYRDTYGLTRPAIEEALNEANVPGDMRKQALVKFDDNMRKQQEQSRAGSKMTGDVFTGDELKISLPKTDFLGYKESYGTGTILALFINNVRVEEVHPGDQVKVILDKTPFYAESGGQVGDTGEICGDKGGRIRITDTQKNNDVFVHIGVVEEGNLVTDQLVHAQIDYDRRLAIMRHHTATHLLQAALREVLGDHVQQQGSMVAEDRLRFDFTHPKAITTDELLTIEKRTNEMVRACDTIVKEYLPLEEAKKRGALAFFAEKYGKTVRVVTIGNYSKEFCGGTHLSSTGEIGLIKVTGENAIAQGIRRIEAKTGFFAWEYTVEEHQQLEQVAQGLKAPVAEVVERVQAQTQRIKQLEKDLEKFRFESLKNLVDNILDSAESLQSDAKLVTYCFQDIDMGLLRQMADLLKKKSKSAIIVLGAKTMENASLLVSVSDDLVKKGVNARDIINEVAPLIDGKGGGRPQLAQAGSKQVTKIDGAVKEANKIIKEKLTI